MKIDVSLAKITKLREKKERKSKTKSFSSKVWEWWAVLVVLIGSGLFVSIGRARFCGQNTKCGPSKSNLTVEFGILYASHELICFWKWSLLISPGFAQQTISSGTVKRLSLPNICAIRRGKKRKSIKGN